MQFTKNFKKRLIYSLGRKGIRLGKWGDWDGLEAAYEIPRYINIEAWRMEYKPSGSVLDVGCGSGIVLARIHTSNSPHVRYCGIDRSRPAIRLARSRIKDGELESFIRRDIRNACQLIKEDFDFIIFNEVLYYIDDPIAIIEQYKCILKETGIFVVSVWHNCQVVDSGWDKTWQSVHGAYQKHCIKAVFIPSEQDPEGNGWHQGLYSKSEVS